MRPYIRIIAACSLVLFSSYSTGQNPDQGAVPNSVSDQSTHGYSPDLLAKVREAASLLAGEPPIQINFIKIAESHRTYADIIEGGSQERFVSARTAFQIQFPDKNIMLDSGMDEDVHRFFGFGRQEPYWQERNAKVQQALRAADKIIITHEHGDHIAGVIRSKFRDELAPKTLLTREQIHTLVNRPQIPEIAITEDQALAFELIDYEGLLPVATGVVLIKAAGHTPGHQMLYVRLHSQKEFLFIGDVGWSLDNITQLKPRPARTVERIGEDTEALIQQMHWIKDQMEIEGLIVVPSHDDLLLQKLVQDGTLNDTLAL